MCEANAYILRKDGKEELVLGDLNVLRPEGKEFFLQNIFGEQKRIQARLKEIDLLAHKVLLEES